MSHHYFTVIVQHILKKIKEKLALFWKIVINYFIGYLDVNCVLEIILCSTMAGGRRSADARSAPSDEEYDTPDNWSTASVLSEGHSDSIPEEGKPV